MLQAIVFLPLLAALVAGLGQRWIGVTAAKLVTTAALFASCALSWPIFLSFVAGTGEAGVVPVLQWVQSGALSFDWELRIDTLTAVMLVVITTVSALVHLYSWGYMEEDPDQPRFFAYLSLFTFAMLMLVTANNLVQMFFGWEGVGLASYLLIGFWYKKPSANAAAIKAFVVNRVGDLGFMLGIFGTFLVFGTVSIPEILEAAPGMAGSTITFLGMRLDTMTILCLLLFIGAMGKSAQVPLHVWLPDSMEGPTPISALIHAATMVTAGIFMVARMSPLFELSETALSFVLVIGAITAFFMALVATVQYDIKRVVAYSTLSQLGYMTMALGASAYSAAIFHLFTHAFFKAVLFLGAGSVIIAMHHQQDMRRMGGLAKYMPITYATMLIGALANAGLPPFAGFFSKDTIIEALHHATVPGAGFAFALAVAGVFVGGFYSFRLVFYTFHGKERFADPHDPDVQAAAAEARAAGQHDDHGHDDHHGEVHPPHESPAVVWVPLVLLAIPSIGAGWLIGSVVYGSYFGNAIAVSTVHPAIATLAKEFHGVTAMIIHAVGTQPFWLAVAGAGTAWFIYIVRPELPAMLRRKWGVLVTILMEKYGFDRFNDWFFAGGARALGTGLWKGGDVAVIDNLMVNGSARLVGWCAGVVRRVQSGYIYHYAFAMIFGVLLLLTLTLFVA